MAVKYNLAIPIANYERGGQQFTKWQTVGAIFENADGKLSMRINCIPTHHIDPSGREAAWDGWVKIFDANNDREVTYREPGIDDFTDPRDGPPF